MPTSRSDSVLVNGRALLVDAQVEDSPPGEEAGSVAEVRATAGDASVQGRLHSMGPRLVLHTNAGRRVDAFLAPLPHGAWIWVEGRARRVLDAESPEARRRAPGSGDN